MPTYLIRVWLENLECHANTHTRIREFCCSASRPVWLWSVIVWVWCWAAGAAGHTAHTFDFNVYARLACATKLVETRRRNVEICVFVRASGRRASATHKELA